MKYYINFNYISDSDNDSNNSSCSSTVSNNEEEEKNEHNNICCILDCVNCLMILHRNEFKNEEDHQQIKDIQDSSITCLIKIFKFYKVIIFYYYFFFTFYFFCYLFKVKIIRKNILVN